MKHIEEPLTLQHFRKEDFENLKDKRPIFRLGEFLLQNFNERDHFIKIIQEDLGIDVEIQCVTDQRLA